MTTDHPRRPAAPRRRLLAPLPAAAFAVLLGLSCAAPASASVEEPAPALDLTLTPAAQGFLAPGASLTTTITAENVSTETVPAGAASLSLGRTPLADRAQLRAWLGGAAEGIPLTPVGTGAAEEIAPRQADTVAITVPADDPALAGLAPGVYPLRATVGDATTESVVVVADRPEPVGIVVPITAPPHTDGLLDAERLAELTAPDGALTAQLEAVSGTEAILAVDPAIPAAIRALRDDAPDSAQEWLDDLTGLPNDRFALQFGDADVAAQLQAGLQEPLGPTSLDAYVTPVEADAEATPTPTPTAPLTPAEDRELALEDLLEVEDAHPSMYWPMPGAAGPSVIEALRAADPEALTLVPSDATAQGDDGAAVAARGEEVLVYDAGVSAALDEVAGAQDGPARDAAVVAAGAELWLAGAEAGDGPLLVALDRGAGIRDQPGAAPTAAPETDAGADGLETRLSAAVDVVTGAVGVDPQRLPELLAAEPVAVTPADAPVDAARTAFVTQTLATEAEVAHTASVLEDPALLTGQVRAEALQVLAVGWRGRNAAWEQAVTAFRERAAERADAVGIEQPATVQLISAGADLPVWIRNDLPYPVSVVLVARPDDPRLDVVEFTQVTAEPDSSTRVQVPVEARVGNGDVDIALSLLASDGQVIGPVQTVEVTVRADWERIGIAVLGTLIAGLLAVGTVRTVLRRRRAKASAERDGDGAEEPPADATVQKGPDA